MSTAGRPGGTVTDREQTPHEPAAPRTTGGDGATAAVPAAPGRDGTAGHDASPVDTRREGTTTRHDTPPVDSRRDGTAHDGTARDETARYEAPQVDTRRDDTPPQGTAGVAAGTAPEYTTQPVAVRRPDSLAGVLLVLAGVAAAVSLLLRWVADSDVSGWGLLRDGFTAFGDGRGFSSGLWQPTAVILGGGVLLLLGLLVLLPARTHRFLGLLALLVAGVVVVAVLVPLAQESWDLARFDTGIFFAMAVAALGVLGALKALATGPRRGARTHHSA